MLRIYLLFAATEWLLFFANIKNKTNQNRTKNFS